MALTCCDQVDTAEMAGRVNPLPGSTALRDGGDRDSSRFSTEHLKADLGGHSVRGGAVTLATQAGRFVVNLGGTAVLARLLVPQDFGLLLMIFALTGFVEIFRDMGLSTATVQVADINHRQLSALFWLNLLLSAALTVIVAAGAPLAAMFYHEPRLTKITLALSTTFFIGGLATQHRALLNRQMRFAAFGLTDLAGVTAGLVAGIICAWFTRSYWALVVMQIVQYAVTTITSWIVTGWRPSLPVRESGVGSMVKFGANLAGFNFVNCFSRSLDNVLIGRWWGDFALGLYGNAYKLLMAPILQISMPFSKVAIPAMSRLQNEPVKYRAYYRKAVMLLASVGMPLVVFLFVAAKETILVFLGPKWVQAVPIFQVLGPAAFFGTFNMATGWVYTSLGRSDRQFRWGILTAIVTVTAFFIAIPHGAVAVGAAFSIVYCGLTMGYPGFAYCFRGTPLKLSDMVAAVWRPAVSSILAGAVVFLMLPVLRGHGPAAVSLGIEGILFAIGYLAMWVILPGGMEFIRSVMSMAGHLKVGRWTAGGSRQPTGFEAKVA